MEDEVRNLRARCARLARLVRGDPADGGPPAAAAAAPTARAAPAADGGRPEDECWVENGVQKAAAAMEAGRRRAVEEEVER